MKSLMDYSNLVKMRVGTPRMHGFPLPHLRNGKSKSVFDSDDQGKVWLNGKKVYAHRRTRGAQIDRRTIPVTLVAGKNTILVKVCNESLPWGFFPANY